MYLFSHANSLFLLYVKAFSFAENQLSDPTLACSHLEFTTDSREKMLSKPFYISSSKVWQITLQTILS